MRMEWLRKGCSAAGAKGSVPKMRENADGFTWYHGSMTNVDVVYRYAQPPQEAAMRALGALRDVYGVRRLALQPEEKTVRVEYDATRLTRPLVLQLLRRAGFNIVEEVALTAAQPAAASPASAP